VAKNTVMQNKFKIIKFDLVTSLVHSCNLARDFGHSGCQIHMRLQWH